MQSETAFGLQAELF